MAKEAGVQIAISTDAHRILELNHMRYGIDVARRGWLEKKNIVNTLSLKDLKKALKK
jgi:DNA polymerase (family 10)